MQIPAARAGRDRLERGYVQVYTGDGKGKTTAAIGLAIRAAGAGLYVFFAQFIKGLAYSEIVALNRFADRITVEQFGRGCFIHGEPQPADIQAAHDGLTRIADAIREGNYDMVVLDEAIVAVQCRLFPVERLLDLIADKPQNVELILTGRYACKALLEKADLVTEMREVKHYYHQGIGSRRGIEL
ncbi:MAG: cob(I)yrinic acid a,c-diamide adenosyltransferase [Phycisphaerae bacterium]|nr:cob(I)yrinic acid a,c-diamide adenosyltransferase [Phycisphaerae bacterium]